MKTLATLLFFTTAALAQETFHVGQTNAVMMWVVVHHSADTIVLKKVTREAPPTPTQVPPPWTINPAPVTNVVSIAPVNPIGMVPGVILPQGRYNALRELETNTATGVIRTKRPRRNQRPQR